MGTPRARWTGRTRLSTVSWSAVGLRKTGRAIRHACRSGRVEGLLLERTVGWVGSINPALWLRCLWPSELGRCQPSIRWRLSAASSLRYDPYGESREGEERANHEIGRAQCRERVCKYGELS